MQPNPNTDGGMADAEDDGCALRDPCCVDCCGACGCCCGCWTEDFPDPATVFRTDIRPTGASLRRWDRDELIYEGAFALARVHNLPAWMQKAALGRDMREISAVVVDALLKKMGGGPT